MRHFACVFATWRASKLGAQGLPQRWRPEPTIKEVCHLWGKALAVYGTGELPTFNQPTSQPISQSDTWPTQQTSWFFLSTGQTFNRLANLTHALAPLGHLRLRPCWGGGASADTNVLSIVARPVQLLQALPSLSRSGILKTSPNIPPPPQLSRGLRRDKAGGFHFLTFPSLWGGRQKDRGERKDRLSWATDKVSHPLTGSYSTGQTTEIIISVIFLCRSVYSSRFGRLLAQLGEEKVSLVSLPPLPFVRLSLSKDSLDKTKV